MQSDEIKYLPKYVITKKNFLYYFMIAGFCSLIDLSVLYVLTELAGLFYLLSATLSFILAQSLNYYLNKALNFRNKSRQIAKQLTMFVAVNAVGLGISLGMLALLVEIFGLWYIPARIISMLIAFNLNYFIHKRYTFSIFD